MKNNKKILLITESLGSGGAERQLVGLAVLLKERGYAVKVATYYAKQYFAPFLKENGVDYEFLPGAFDKKKRLFLVSKLIKAFRPDSVVSFLPVPNKMMCALKMFYRYRLIVSERSHTREWNLETFIRFNLYRMADKVVCNSLAETENIKRHYPFLRDKTEGIVNYVDTDVFAPSGEKVKDSVNILSVGRVIESKNVLRALDAVSALRDRGYKFELTWIGSHYDTDYVASVRERIRAKGLDGRVRLLDQQENLLPFYQEATFFFFPSLYEGYPNVLCEAMSCGIPVVCSNVCEMPLMVKEGVNGFLFRPDDTGGMVAALERMLNVGEERYGNMRTACRRQVVRENSAETFVERYMEII